MKIKSSRVKLQFDSEPNKSDFVGSVLGRMEADGGRILPVELGRAADLGR